MINNVDHPFEEPNIHEIISRTYWFFFHFFTIGGMHMHVMGLERRPHLPPQSYG